MQTNLNKTLVEKIKLILKFYSSKDVRGYFDNYKKYGLIDDIIKKKWFKGYIVDNT